MVDQAEIDDLIEQFQRLKLPSRSERQHEAAHDSHISSCAPEGFHIDTVKMELVGQGLQPAMHGRSRYRHVATAVVFGAVCLFGGCQSSNFDTDGRTTPSSASLDAHDHHEAPQAEPIIDYQVKPTETWSQCPVDMNATAELEQSLVTPVHIELDSMTSLDILSMKNSSGELPKSSRPWNPVEDATVDLLTHSINATCDRVLDATMSELPSGANELNNNRHWDWSEAPTTALQHFHEDGDRDEDGDGDGNGDGNGNGDGRAVIKQEAATETVPVSVPVHTPAQAVMPVPVPEPAPVVACTCPCDRTLTTSFVTTRDLLAWLFVPALIGIISICSWIRHLLQCVVQCLECPAEKARYAAFHAVPSSSLVLFDTVPTTLIYTRCHWLSAFRVPHPRMPKVCIVFLTTSSLGRSLVSSMSSINPTLRVVISVPRTSHRLLACAKSLSSIQQLRVSDYVSARLETRVARPSNVLTHQSWSLPRLPPSSVSETQSFVARTTSGMPSARTQGRLRLSCAGLPVVKKSLLGLLSTTANLAARNNVTAALLSPTQCLVPIASSSVVKKDAKKDDDRPGSSSETEVITINVPADYVERQVVKKARKEGVAANPIMKYLQHLHDHRS